MYDDCHKEWEGEGGGEGVGGGGVLMFFNQSTAKGHIVPRERYSEGERQRHRSRISAGTERTRWPSVITSHIARMHSHVGGIHRTKLADDD